jgi:hypothetical protein
MSLLKKMFSGDKKEEDIRLPLDVRKLLKKELGEAVYKTAESAINKAYLVMRLYPASQSHHDSDKGGLWRHSLDTALALYRLFPKYEREIVVENPLTKNLSYNDTYLQREQYRLLSFFIGLFHDIGKVAEYDLFPTANSRLALNVLNTEAFIGSVKDLDVEEIVIKKKTLRRDMLHPFVSAFLMPLILPARMRCGISPFILAKAMQAIALEHTDITIDNLFLRMLKRGDSETTKESMETEVRTIAERKGGNYLVALKSGILKTWDINIPDNFRVFIDKDKGYVIINSNIALNKMMEALRLTRDAVFEIIRESGLCALALNNREIVLLKSPELKVKSIPAIVFKLSAFEFDEKFLTELPKCPAYDLISKKDIDDEEGKKKKERPAAAMSAEEPESTTSFESNLDPGRDDPIIND